MFPFKADKIFEVSQEFQEVPMENKNLKDKIFEARQKFLNWLYTICT